mgnify:CR=1 FL=1
MCMHTLEWGATELHSSSAWGLGVQGSAYPLQAQLRAARNELTIANELEHHTRGTT